MAILFKRKANKNIEDMRQEMKRRMSQEQRMLRLFQEKRQVTNVQLAQISYRYSARIGNLRKKYRIPAPLYIKPGVYLYTYLGEK